jgi:uncharacterized protein (TIGR02569 family)
MSTDDLDDPAAAHVPPAVRAAFGIGDGSAIPLEGGQGSSVRAGALVLKPYADDAEVAWFAGLVERVVCRGFRLPAPIAAVDGRWTVEGWSAVEHAAGEAEPEGRWSEVLDAGRAFHAAVAHEPEPPHLRERTHRWAVADRVAWGERTLEVGASSRPLLDRLEALRRPVGLPFQLVHGDLSGNVLLADGLAPAVIDVSPYWRPAAYADAVVVVDALLWWSADAQLVDELTPRELDDGDWQQLLVRAAVFRLVSLDEAGRRDDPDVAAQLPAYDRIVELLEHRARS